MLVDALVEARRTVPNLEAVIVGEGYDRGVIERRIAEAQAESWLRLTGYVHEDEKVDWYRRAWLLASASAHEGWGMTATEAAACGTPSVVTDIAGHRDAVADGVSGLLVPGPAALGPAIARVLTDGALRERLTSGARAYASRFTWGATAYGTLKVLCDQRVRDPQQ